MTGRPTVAVLFNEPALPPGHPDATSEADVVEVALAVADALHRGGFEARLVAAGPPLARLIESLTGPRPDAVFNLIEGFAGSSGGEAYVTGLLELLAIPYTGCPPEAQGLCRRKSRTKALLAGHGLPTAAFALVESAGELPDLAGDGPWIVKPDAEDASLGIDQGSVVSDRGALKARVESLRATYGSTVLIESYLPGPEYNVGVLALPTPVPLPAAEVTFADRPGCWPILTYEAKWAAGSAEDLASPIACPAQIDGALRDRLGTLAVAAFRATGCRDCARVDFRLDAAGRPMILEVNPEPRPRPGRGLGAGLACVGTRLRGDSRRPGPAGDRPIRRARPVAFVISSCWTCRR